MQHDCAMRFWEGAGKRNYDFVISGENYRLSELSAALFVAQIDRLDPHCSRSSAPSKRASWQGWRGPARGSRCRMCPTRRASAASPLPSFAPNPDMAKRFAAALNAENIRCGTIYDNTIPDRHIYANWPFMMSGLAEERRAPWKSPFYKGQRQGL